MRNTLNVGEVRVESTGNLNWPRFSWVKTGSRNKSSRPVMGGGVGEQQLVIGETTADLSKGAQYKNEHLTLVSANIFTE